MQISKINSNNKNVSFGWLAQTHSYLTRRAITKVPELMPYSKFIVAGSFLPDIKLSQTSLFGRDAHYFVGKGFNSFDLAPQNASDFYYSCIFKAFEYLRLGDSKLAKGLAMLKAGEALHFIQDMAVPLHTQKECQKPLQIFRHLSYESLAKKNHELIDDMFLRTNTIKDENFKDLFIDAYNKSSSMDNPLKKGQREHWSGSIEEAYSNAFDATCKFLKRFSAISEAEPSTARELVNKEILSAYR